MRDRAGKSFVAIALITAAFALVSCDAFLTPPKVHSDGDGSTGSLAVSFGASRASARTVTADDFAGSVSGWTIDLSRADGAKRTVTGAGATVTVSGLVPGTWDIAVAGRNADGTVIFTGSVTGVAIAADATVPVTVPVVAVPSVNGTLRLTVTVPSATNVRSATATVDPGAASPVIPTITVIEDFGLNTRAFVFEASLSPGAHILSFNLFRSGPSVSTPAGSFIEAVNIYPGIVSDRWIDAYGTLQAVRALGWDDLVSTDRQLHGIEVSVGAAFEAAVGFMPGETYTPAVPNSQTVLTGDLLFVRMSPIEAVIGQTLEYRIAPTTTWTPILSGAWTDNVNPGETVFFRVVSPNGDATWNNAYQIDTIADYRVRYHSNGEVVENEQVFAETFAAADAPFPVRAYDTTPLNMLPETIAGATGIFIGWNTARNGLGIAYTEVNTINPPANLELYAQWQNPAVPAAIAVFETQLALGVDSNVRLPAYFTANDLQAVRDMIDASPMDVWLDLQDTSITSIPPQVFIGHMQLTRVILPATIAFIDAGAFQNTLMVMSGPEVLDCICLAPTPPTLGTNAFGPVGAMSADFYVYVPAAAEAAYEGAAVWSTFGAARIVPYP